MAFCVFGEGAIVLLLDELGGFGQDLDKARAVVDLLEMFVGIEGRHGAQLREKSFAVAGFGEERRFFGRRGFHCMVLWRLSIG